MAYGTIYETATGRILRLVTAPQEFLSDQIGDGESLLQAFSDTESQYVLAEVLTNKPTSPTTIDTTTITANGTSTATLANIPNPSTVTINVPQGADSIGQFTVTDGILLFATTFAGAYLITIDKYPYMPFTVTVTAS